ncbi:MAG: DUF4339 domain-containing protein [Planctomycetota bacterium]|nr:DUF4339 domain-containing protein [Planctomycetota bacterium]
MADWFVKRGERELGPLSVERLKNLADEGKLKPDDLVRKDDAEYKLASQFKGLLPADDYDDGYDDPHDDYDGGYDDHDDYEDDYDDRRGRSSRRPHRSRRRGVSVSQRTTPPAICYYVITGLSIAYWCYYLVSLLIGLKVNQQMFDQRMGPMRDMFVNGTIGAGIIVGCILVVNFLILIGAINLHLTKSYGLAMTGAILSLIPCITSCCIGGIPIGIWALVVLNDPDVRDSFG